MERVKVHLRSGGKWEHVNGEWEFLPSGQPSQFNVLLPKNITHFKLAGYCKKKFGIVTDGGEMKIVHKTNGEIYQISDDECVRWFMNYASGCETPPTLYVHVDYPVYGGGDVGGSSNVENTQEEEEEEEEEEDEEEGEQEEDGDVEEEDEEEKRRFAGCDDDEAIVFEMTDTDEEEAGVERVTPANNSFGRINDFFDMPPLLETPESYSMPNEPVPYNRSYRISLNQTFTTKDEMIVQLGRKFLEEGFQYKTSRSSKTRYEVRCDQKDCTWRMTAYPVGGPNTMFQVRTLVDVHTCSETQLNPRHRQANTKILGNILKHKFVDASRTCRPKDIISDLRETYGVTIGYYQGWRARWSAIRMIRGTPEDSFTRLPAYFYNLEHQNPGSFTRIKTDSTGRFEKCFAALHPAIVSFKTKLRRVLVIDAAHLKGRFLGTMFLAVAMDGNNNIVPIAFGVGKSETTDEWTWFLAMLRECIGELPGLVFMSDRAAAISAGITAVFPTAHHALCCRHLKMNVKTRDVNIKNYKDQFWKACKAYTEYEFNRRMNTLRLHVPAGAQLMDELGPERWSRAYFPGVRFNIMTSNSAESVNALSRFARRLPIVILMEYFREFQQRWYFLRRQKGGS